MATHSLEINNRVGARVPKNILEKVLQVTMSEVGGRLKTKNTETSLALITDRSMANLNRMYRQKTGPTNVLSFSFVRIDRRAPSRGPMPLGDILISPAQIRLAAKNNRHSYEIEMGLVFLHGLLHVLKFDHEEDSKVKAAMERAEQKIIKKIPGLKKAAGQSGLIRREFVYP